MVAAEAVRENRGRAREAPFLDHEVEGATREGQAWRVAAARAVRMQRSATTGRPAGRVIVLFYHRNLPMFRRNDRARAEVARQASDRLQHFASGGRGPWFEPAILAAPG